jgi:hypothetical protein
MMSLHDRYGSMPEVQPAASDGCLRVQSGRWQTVQRSVYEFTA